MHGLSFDLKSRLLQVIAHLALVCVLFDSPSGKGLHLGRAFLKSMMKPIFYRP